MWAQKKRLAHQTSHFDGGSSTGLHESEDRADAVVLVVGRLHFEAVAALKVGKGSISYSNERGKASV